MARRRRPAAATWDDVRRVAASLDEVDEGTSYGTPALRARGTLFARFHQDGESLVVRVDPAGRDAMIEAEPETYYLTDHYRDYPWVLVRLAHVHVDALDGLLRTAWRLATASTRRAAPARSGRRRA